MRQSDWFVLHEGNKLQPDLKVLKTITGEEAELCLKYFISFKIYIVYKLRK